jgi:hypothetical protein
MSFAVKLQITNYLTSMPEEESFCFTSLTCGSEAFTGEGASALGREDFVVELGVGLRVQTTYSLLAENMHER